MGNLPSLEKPIDLLPVHAGTRGPKTEIKPREREGFFFFNINRISLSINTQEKAV